MNDAYNDDAPDACRLFEAVAGEPPAQGCEGTQGETPARYQVRGLWDIASKDTPPLTYVWNGIALVGGSVIEVIGAPGIGKSRIVADLARHQILGRDFGGRATSQPPLKWLFAGSENGIHRLNYEAVKFLFRRTPNDVRGMDENARLALADDNGFSTADVRALDENFRTFTLENPEDFDISLANEANVAKLTETLRVERPQILVFDPWGDCIAGKELDDGDVRETVRLMRLCLATAGLKQTVIIIVNHARMGAKEEASARGADEGNFGKNSKCLFSIARYVLNVRRASFDDTPDIEIVNAKNSDGRKQPPLALRLDGDSMSYEPIPGFDHGEWQESLEEAARENGRGRVKKASSPDTLLEGAIKILEAAGDELLGVATFKEKMVEAGLASSVEAAGLRAFLKARREERGTAARIVFHRELWRPGDGDRATEKPKSQHGVEFVSTPKYMGRYLRNWGIVTEMGLSC